MNTMVNKIKPVNASITATIEGYTFQSRDNNFCVVQLQEKGKPGLTTATGYLPGVPVGSSVRLMGSWNNDKKYGQQFKFDQYHLLRPNTLNGLEKYLGSGLIKGIGPRYAFKIVKRFGIETLDIIETAPERLTEVPGLGSKRANRIKKAWAKQKDIQDIMIFLQGEGISSTYAIKIYKRYGKDSIARVKENPYQLAEDIRGVGFKVADRIAGTVGVQAESPLRIQAGILHALSEAAKSGHCYLPEDELVLCAADILGLPEEAISAQLPPLIELKKIFVEADMVSLALLHYAEMGIASMMAELIRRPSPLPDMDKEKAISWAGKKMGITFAAAQAEAIRTIISGKVSILTGGPGTGKTTILRAILLILKKRGIRIALAAPTGRAAKKMAEVTGKEAKTIHRLLEYDPSVQGFKKGVADPLDIDLLVVDESSMLDVVLCNSLLKALPVDTSLLLVGDVDQLPSVGPGNVLRDLIDSGAIPVVTLRHIFRQGEGSLISLNASNINEGLSLDLRPEYRGEKDFYCIFKEEQEDILGEILSLCKERLPGRFGWDPVRDIQVLTPMKRGIIGAANLNTMLQKHLNPQGPSLRRGARVLRIGDKVMQIRNNYDKEVFNGDMGRVKRIDDEEQVMIVDFDGRDVEYGYGGELDEIILSYATSIHKAQGSEYPCVIIALHTSHYMLLQRNLLYTAVTRGKKLVILISSKKALAIAINNNRPVNRYTRLSQEVRELMPGG